MRPLHTRLAIASGIVVVSVASFAGAASAHIAIGDGTAPAGAEVTVLHFHVPNESDTASTTKIEIAIPDSVVLPFLLARPNGDWKVTTDKRTLTTTVKTEGGEVTEVVSKVTFEGGKIGPGEFDTFDLEVGPLPDTEGATLAFPTIQTYDDGTVSKWIDKVVEGQPEPESPTPLVALVAGSPGQHGIATSPTSHSDSHVLGLVAVIVGAVGVLLGLASLVTGRRRQS